MNKTIVIGLDGFTWQVAEKLSLPNIEEILHEGGGAKLQSTLPPVTCPAWPSFLTGKHPSKHKAHDFAYLDESKRLRLADFSNIKTPGLIQTTGWKDLKSIFFEIPVTHPAPDNEGILLSGYPCPITPEKFSPGSIQDDLESDLGSFPPIAPGRYTGHNRTSVLEKFTESLVYRKKAFLRLIKTREWSFAASNFYLADQFSHFFWDEFAGRNDNNPLASAYRSLDELVGGVRETIPENTNLFLMSDHGFGSQAHTVNLNRYLLGEGFLVLKNSFWTKVKVYLMRLGLSPARLKNLTDSLNLSSLLANLGRKHRDQLLNQFLSFQDIDWDNSDAYSLGHVGQIYWIGNGQKSRSGLRDYLLSLESEDGNSLVDELIPLRDDPEQPSAREPLWLLKMNGWADIAYPLLTSSWNFTDQPNNAGCHRPEGILAWSGPDLEQATPDSPKIIDLAPTIHRLLGIPLQHDFDGRVLTEILAESAPEDPGCRNFSSPGENSTDSQDEMVDQLKNLGYL